MIMVRELILDVDTGVDDALAILFALRCPQLQLRALTCVAGNVGVDQVVQNTLKVLDAAAAPPVPVARGAGAPLSGEAVDPAIRSVHGTDGLADLGLPPPGRVEAAVPAVDLLRTEILRAAEPPTIVCCGPLTNLALLQREAPALLREVRQLVVVGGVATGEIGTAGDFNLRHDLAAARAVLGSGVPATLYSLDVFAEVALTAAEVAVLAAGGDSGARLAGLLARHQLRRSGGREACLGDAGAVVAVVAPDGLRTRPHPYWPQVSVAVAVDAPAYRRLFRDALPPERIF
jgi:pyrimidine-specific ribonucleoside hydrolase